MAKVEVVFYKEDDGFVPVLRWLESLPKKVLAKCTERIERLAEMGYELRRPEADLLRDKIYELRIGFQGTHYRILYFFYKNKAAILSHGIQKEKKCHPKKFDMQ